MIIPEKKEKRLVCQTCGHRFISTVPICPKCDGKEVKEKEEVITK